MAPRASWKGYLKLSLVSCPIALYPAVSSSERVSFNRINKKTGSKLKQQLVDGETGETVDKEDIGRGYEIGKGQFLEVEDEEIEKIRIESSHTISIETFVPRSEIDDRYLDDPYYIAPTDQVGQEAFAVIRDAIRDKGMVALGRVVLSRRESRLLRKHDHHAARHQYAALVRPVRMKIDDRPTKVETGSCLADSCNDSWKTAAMVEMPVRQENVLDCGKIDPEPSGIVEPDVWIGSDIEQHAALPVAPATGNQHRESVTGAAELIEHNLAVMPFVLSAWSGSGR